MSDQKVVEVRPAARGLKALQPRHWPKPRGYANGMVGHGSVVVLGGQIGWDETGAHSDDFLNQTAQALRNVVTVLAEAGGSPQHIARLTWYVTDMDEYRNSTKALGPIWRDIMGRHYPAMSVVGVSSLVEPWARIEVEATAVIPD